MGSVKAYGPTQYGNLYTYIQLDEITDYTFNKGSGTFSKQKTKLQVPGNFFVQLNRDDLYAQAGDVFTEITELSAPHIQYQGAVLKGVSLGNNTTVDFYGGATGRPYWGGDFWRESTLKSGFVGVKVQEKITSSVRTFVSVFSVSQFSQVDGVVNQRNTPFIFRSLGLSYAMAPFAVDTEYGLSRDDTSATYLKFTYDKDKFRATTEIKRSSKGFQSVSNEYTSADLSVINQNLDYTFNPDLRGSAAVSAITNPDISDRPYYLSALGLHYNNQSLPSLDLEASVFDQRALTGGIYNIYLSAYSQYFIPKTPLSIYGYFKPTYLKNFLDSRTSSTRDYEVYGGLRYFKDFFYAQAEAGNESQKEDLVGNVFNQSFARLSGGVTEFPLWRAGNGGYYLNLTGRFDWVRQNGVNGKIYGLTSRLTLKNVITDLFYIEGAYEKRSLFSDADRYNTFLWKVGVEEGFDTGIVLRPQNINAIRGFVFADLNHNGLRDAAEPGVGEVAVICGSDKVMSDSDGYYQLKGITSRIVDFSLRQYPFAKIMESNPYTLDFSNASELVLNLPVNFDRSFKVSCYEDLNANGIFDQGTDSILSGAKIWVHNLATEERTVVDGGTKLDLSAWQTEYELDVDISGLPSELKPLRASDLKIGLNPSIFTDSEIFIPLVKKGSEIVTISNSMAGNLKFTSVRIEVRRNNKLIPGTKINLINDDGKVEKTILNRTGVVTTRLVNKEKPWLLKLNIYTLPKALRKQPAKNLMKSVVAAEDLSPTVNEVTANTSQAATTNFIVDALNVGAPSVTTASVTKEDFPGSVASTGKTIEKNKATKNKLKKGKNNLKKGKDVKQPMVSAEIFVPTLNAASADLGGISTTNVGLDPTDKATAAEIAIPVQTTQNLTLSSSATSNGQELVEKPLKIKGKKSDKGLSKKNAKVAGKKNAKDRVKKGALPLVKKVVFDFKG